MTTSPATTPFEILRAEVAAILADQGYTYDFRAMSWNQYLATAVTGLVSTTSNLTTGRGQMLAELATAAGADADHLRDSKLELMAKIIDGSFAAPTTGPVVSAILNAGGSQWTVGEQGTINAGDSGAVVNVDSIFPAEVTWPITDGCTDGTFQIISVDGPSKTILAHTSLVVDWSKCLEPGIVIQLLDPSQVYVQATHISTVVFDTDHLVIVVTDALDAGVVTDGYVFTAGQFTVTGDATALTGDFVVTGTSGTNRLFTVVNSFIHGGDTRIYATFDNLVNDDPTGGTVHTIGTITGITLVSGGDLYSTDTGVTLTGNRSGIGATVDVTI